MKKFLLGAASAAAFCVSAASFAAPGPQPAAVATPVRGAILRGHADGIDPQPWCRRPASTSQRCIIACACLP
jgi:hypothetical protein